MNPALKIQKILTFECFSGFTLDLPQDCPFSTTLHDLFHWAYKVKQTTDSQQACHHFSTSPLWPSLQDWLTAFQK